MSYTYDQCKRPQGQQNAAPEQTAAPGPDVRALMTGAARPTAAQKGRSFDLDGAIKAKMEHAFGDLSAVKLYESRAVREAGAEAVAQGNEIAFAPGMADFSTRSGQERLGHELSHVMSQRSGQVRGQGFLVNSALEARADREGAMAAAGEQVYAGPVTHALSGAAPSPFAAGPMQAKRKAPQEMRPYEMSEKALKKNAFNPGQVLALTEVQDAIQNASTGAEAYKIFAAFAGNKNGKVLDATGKKAWNMEEEMTANRDGKQKNFELDTQLFKDKLKHMTRQVYDFPELRGHIGRLRRTDQTDVNMYTDASYNEQTNEPTGHLFYNPYSDRKGNSGIKERSDKEALIKQMDLYTGTNSRTGNHELGHIQNYLVADTSSKEAFLEDMETHTTANSLLDAALKNTLSKSKYNKLKRYKKTDEVSGKKKGQIDLVKSKLWNKGLTSKYGQENASEFLAEAFRDVYQNGKKARKLSIELVKQYEKLRDEKKKKVAG